MKNYQTSQIRNVGVVAHGGAGKTSLVEAMLYNTGILSRLGRVEDGTTTADYHPEEVAKQITIHTSLVPCEWNGVKINLLDTPGFSDFIGEVKGALRVADCAMFVISAVDGVEVQHEVIWDIAEKYNLPKIIFVNKMDRENASFNKVIDELKTKFKGNFAPLQIPNGSFDTFTGVVDIIDNKAYTGDGKGKEAPVPGELAGEIGQFHELLVEAAAEGDDDLTMKYLEGEELSLDEIKDGLKKSIAQAKVVPVMAGSATKNIGVVQLMDVIVDYLPAPKEDNGPMSALIFKTIADPYVGKMNFLRVFSGIFKSDTVVYNSKKEKTEKIGNVLYVRGKNTTQTDVVPTGDLAVVVKLQDTATGDTLCDKDKPVVLEGIDFPVPTLSVAIAPKSKNDEDKLGDALNKLLEEDPTMKVEKNTETKQTLITGMGELHINIMIERLKRKFGVDVVTNDAKVPYRETIRAKVEVEGKHKKQSGGRGQYGHVWIRFEPNPEEDFVFEEDVFGGSVPRNYFPAVEKGLREAMTEGVLAGYPTTGVKATLYDGSYHTVDSSELAFKIAASLAFKKGAMQAKPVLLEPMMDVEVLVPDNFMGDIISDFNTKRGRVLGTEPQEKQTLIKAHVPLSEMYRYAIDLKSMTQGRGSFTMEFTGYEEVPGRLAEDIIKKAKAAQEADK
ncbi:elongation factor G [Pelotomaculum terephthalicicum JT]|uniref:elongation factor G n=1 Tax=Pelotomaculum TaxID=191373 RepID=UPI0009D39DE2|nr:MULTISPECIES: elongation factor G [Pelotomaculum]MCG9967644.1 elongation factor G [Pelotomaculum terephthalicicum JT]OPX84057.1 MAG: Elongation factor G [Pelotomaculum sp. PtaB.Bin117]OPY60861.1 MAG: Elongation factor G [Pelotomaculum sp. PtaU1.Bin065]